MRAKLGPIKAAHKLDALDLVVETKTDKGEKIYFRATASPPDDGKTLEVKTDDKDGAASINLTRPKWIETKDYNVYIKVKERHEAATADSDKAGRRAPSGAIGADGRFKDKGKWARRHVLSSYDMKVHYEKSLILPKKTTKTAGEALSQRGSPLAEQKKEAIQPAAQSLLARFHNDAVNLWVGDTHENSSFQENVDASPDMYDKPNELNVQKLQTHIQQMANTYAIPGESLDISNKLDAGLNFKYQYQAA